MWSGETEFCTSDLVRNNKKELKYDAKKKFTAVLSVYNRCYNVTDFLYKVSYWLNRKHVHGSFVFNQLKFK